MNQKSVAALILSLLEHPGEGWILAMDRTNWKFGKVHIEIPVMTVVIGGMGFPIAWMMLPKRTKRGNSDTSHRFKVKSTDTTLNDTIDMQTKRIAARRNHIPGAVWLLRLIVSGVGA